MGLQTVYHNFRRWALRTFVPDFFWPEAVDVDGVAIRLRKTPYSFGTRWVLKKGEYELSERELFKTIAHPGMQVLEMGSSIGIMAAVMAKQIGPTGRLVTIEASPELTAYSRTWLHAPGRVDVVTGYGFPVWQAPESLRVQGFNQSCSLGGTVSFSTTSNGSAPTPTPAGPSAAAKQETPGIYDISSACREFNLRPEAVVIDIEGSEALLLSQPPNLPEWIRYILIELHPWMYPNEDRDKQAIIDVLIKDGFRLKQQHGTAWLFERQSSPSPAR